MTAPGILNHKDEAASRALIAFVNHLFRALEREYPAQITRIKMKTMKLMQEQGIDQGISDAFHAGLKKQPICVPPLPLSESQCRDIVQISYNVACDTLGPVDTDGAFTRAVDAVNRSAESRDYPISSLL